MMTPALIVVLASVLACLVGIVACAVLIRTARHDPLLTSVGRAARVCVYQWAGLYFFGAALVCVNCAMGDRAPLPIVAGFGGAVGIGAVGFAWALLCLAGFVGTKALQAHSERARIRRRWVQGWGYRVPAALLALCLLADGGCTALQTALAPDGGGFVRAEDLTYRAIAPEYLRYVDADAALAADQKARRHTTVGLWRSSIDDRLGTQKGPAGGPATQPATPAP